MFNSDITAIPNNTEEDSSLAYFVMVMMVFLSFVAITSVFPRRGQSRNDLHPLGEGLILVEKDQKQKDNYD